MSTKENHITYTTTGRYFTHGNPKKANTLLVALHGYGQLAPYFIRKFRDLNPDEYFVVCPEGPHRYYQSGSSGRVGASWMTKEDRLTDIKDYINFLDTLQEHVLTRFSFERKVLLGFSQGGATASRWVAYGKYDFDKFLLWAAVFPPDMESSNYLKFKSQENYFIVGSEDEFISSDKAQLQCEQLNTVNLPFKFVNFQGNHTIDFKTLITLLQ